MATRSLTTTFTVDQSLDDLFFEDKQTKYIFYLTRLSDSDRDEALGITSDHYLDRNLADQWYKEILSYILGKEIDNLIFPPIIDSDCESNYSTNFQRAKEVAEAELRNLYQRMIENCEAVKL